MILRLKLITFLFALFGVFTTSYATVYFSYDAENCVSGEYLPQPPFNPYSGDSQRGTCELDATAPQGNNMMQFHYDPNGKNQGHHSMNNEVNGQGLPFTATLGKTYYLAYFFNFKRIGDVDIWNTTGDDADKGVEIDGNGIRWILSRGHWSTLANNQPGRYTVWIGNPTYHLNPSIEPYDSILPNQNGYDGSNPIQLTYDTWHAAVMEVKMASDNTGSIAAYINGEKVFEYNNIQTAANSSPTIEKLTLHGTIGQPSYSAPAHYRNFDALLLTDNWQDIIDGGYLKKVPVPKAPVAY